MLYLAIDQHRKQLTVNLRDEAGDVILKRQVSTEWARVRKFLEEVKQRSAPEGGFMAIVEVCGFNDWLLKLLAEFGCREIVLIQPEKQSKTKTDRRDSDALGELLWTNRQRLLDGKKVQNMRRIVPPTVRDAEDRQLTALRQRIGRLRTRTINKVQHLLLKHHLQQECPTKGIQTQGARKWLAQLPLAVIDRMEMDQLAAQWELWDKQRRLDSRRREQASDVFRERYRKQSGLEATNSLLKRVTGLGRLRIRGSPGVFHSILLKVAGWNLFQAARAIAMRRSRRLAVAVG